MLAAKGRWGPRRHPVVPQERPAP